jgi:membrane protease YdiL (CAAX protease family)
VTRDQNPVGVPLAEPQRALAPQPLDVQPQLGVLKAAGLSLFVLVFGLTSLLTSGALFRGAPRLVAAFGPHVFMILSVVALIHFVLVRYARILPTDLGLRASLGTLKRLVLGVVIGTMMLLTAFCIAWGAGKFIVAAPAPTAQASFADALWLLAYYLVAAVFEELLFRVALVGPLRLALPPSLAVTVPAALFGLAHVLNQHASTLGILNTVVAGILLGLLYLERGAYGSTPSLGLAIGVHAGWNFAMSMLGISVSGHPLSKAVVECRAEDVLWSGGAYGLEAGLGTSLVMLTAAIAAAKYASLSAPRTQPAISE